MTGEENMVLSYIQAAGNQGAAFSPWAPVEATFILVD
jgi:hypothetical protein